MRTVRRWRKLTKKERLFALLIVGASAALVGSFTVGFTGMTPAPYDMYVRGFARYVERRADVEAIQSWLATLDPNDYADEYGGRTDIPIPPAKLPASIARLHPRKAWALPDGAEHVMVRLSWGSGVMGHWGVEVHDAMMEPAPNEYYRYRRWAPGAYIWYELE